MTHQELENLASEYLEGRLDTAHRAEVGSHLDECASCRDLVADLEWLLALCHSSEPVEAPPWLVQRILVATVGERKPSFRQQLAALLRPTLQPRLAYGLAMAVFSITMILTAAGVDVRQMTRDDLKPSTWANWADRTGHRLVARAEMFYYDLRVVYEIESRLKQLRGQPASPAARPQDQQAPKPEAPAGGTTESEPAGPPVLASSGDAGSPSFTLVQMPAPPVGPKRSLP